MSKGIKWIGVGMVCASLAAGALLWWYGEKPMPVPAARHRAPGDRQAVVPVNKTGIVTTAVSSRAKTVTGAVAAVIPGTKQEGLTFIDALSLTEPISCEVRQKLVRGMGHAILTGEQVAAVRQFVASRTLPEGFTLIQMRSYKNALLDLLCVQAGEEAATAAVMRAMVQDEEQDFAMRDYALQHLVVLAERDARVGWATHWEVIEGKNPALAATALLPFSRRYQNNELSSDEAVRVGAVALVLAADASVPAVSRATALQVCAELKLPQARDLAYKYAQAGDAGFPLRISAVAALGRLGGSSEIRTYLESLSLGPEKRLRVPAQAALKRFSIN